MRIMWKEMADDSGVGRQVLKRGLPPLFSTAANFIFPRPARGGSFAPKSIRSVHFMLSLNSVTVGYFTTAAMTRRLWDMNLLEPAMIERRKREVIDIVERTLFSSSDPGSKRRSVDTEKRRELRL